MIRDNIERQMRPAKLNLRHNRPLVSLGYVRRDRRELTTLEQIWASAFICTTGGKSGRGLRQIQGIVLLIMPLCIP